MRRFYTRFKQERAAFLASFNGTGTLEDGACYASLLLSYTMFVFFLQKQIWLAVQAEEIEDGERRSLLSSLATVRREHGRGHFDGFYRTFLLRLFSRQVGTEQRLPGLEKLLDHLPRLPAVLLESERFERLGSAIVIPDEAYERLFRFFEAYEWRLEERSPRDARELGPDVLSVIFEKYSNQKQMGAYYTRADITEYMSAASIIPCLFERVALRCSDLFEPGGVAFELLRADPERYIYQAVKHGCELTLPEEIEAGINDVARRGAWDETASDEYGLPLETWREVVARRQRYAQERAALAGGEIASIDACVTCNLDLRCFAREILLHTRREDQLVAFYTSLEELTVLDPTCGSGEFLLAALAVLEPLYTVCLEQMHLLLTTQAETLEESQDTAALHAILHLATRYGNRRAFIVRSILTNNLYGVDLMREATEVCQLRLFLRLVACIETAAEAELLSEIDLNVRAGNTLVGFATWSEMNSVSEHDPEGWLFTLTQEIERRFAELQDARRTWEAGAAELLSCQRELRASLTALQVALDHYLASTYGLDRHNLPDDEERAAALARWRESFEPFHWIVEWYEIARRGGFAVILGNPPYIAYGEVQQRYQVRLYRTQKCGNLCAYVLERALTLLSSRGRCGMIVPVSTISSASYRSLSQMLLEKQLWISSYSNRPGKLFAGVEQRLAIVLLRNGAERALLTSAYRHWYEPERVHLFATLYYTAASIWQPTGMPVKSGSEMAEAIFARMIQQQGFPLLHCEQPAAAVWVHNGPTYWVRALPFEPNSGQKSSRSDHYGRVPVASQEKAYVLAAILSSSTFYFFYQLVSNCRDLGKKERAFFPLGQLQEDIEARLTRLGQRLAQVLQESAEERMRHYTRAGKHYETHYQEYYPARARKYLDEIDNVLAEHYGFSAEELDFVLHYNYKYRQNGKSDV